MVSALGWQVYSFEITLFNIEILTKLCCKVSLRRSSALISYLFQSDSPGTRKCRKRLWISYTSMIPPCAQLDVMKDTSSETYASLLSMNL